MIKLYLLPIVHLTNPNYNVPKYLPHRLNPALPGLEGLRFAWTTYLLEDVGILITDVTNEQHSLLFAQPDVLPIDNLDDEIPDDITPDVTRDFLESFNIPADWLQSGMTYRRMLRKILGIFYYHNRLVCLKQGRLFSSEFNLKTRVNQIPANWREHVLTAAEDLQMSTNHINPSAKIRDLLNNAGEQFSQVEHQIAG